MAKYSFETHKAEDKEKGVYLVCRAVFELYGNPLEAVQSYYYPDGKEGEKPPKKIQYEMIADIERYIHEYKLTH